MNTNRQNCISPLLMESLQMLKFHFKKEWLNFTESWMTKETEMGEDEPEGDLLSTLLQPEVHVQQNAFDNIMRSINVDEDY